ncbi:MAG: agmatine deiminase family protein [Myxococcota bacterium]|nr:agmatine deiminase family protein [Myxococcota bacterium]
MPAEWGPHAGTWLAWPSHEELWGAELPLARLAVARLVAAIASGEAVHVLVPDESQEALARAALFQARVQFHRVAFGDIWLRDTAPVFLVGPEGAAASVRFSFNGWGGKYVLEGDDGVASRIASRAGGHAYAMPFVLEGGSVEVDGEGSVLTTRQCLLNPNRNPGLGASAIERAVCDALGCEAVLWLDEGLANDHTDGHVDTVARFVRPGVVVVMEARTSEDPNRDVLRALGRAVAGLRDARGRRLEVVRVPSPGRLLDSSLRPMPASYVNFYVSNTCVVVPTYGAPWDDEAVEGIGALYPGRRAIGLDARAILTGGGAFHCITQQQPRPLP